MRHISLILSAICLTLLLTAGASAASGGKEAAPESQPPVSESRPATDSAQVSGERAGDAVEPPATERAGAPARPSGIAASPFFAQARQRISRLFVVSPELVRGGQPDQGGLFFLKKAGVKTIVNLKDLGDKPDRESKDARSMGLNYYNLPLKHTEPVPEQTIRKFLSIVRNPRNQPVFVHCRQGADRTGTMVGIYRIEHNDWGPSRAYQEMLAFNFHPILRNLTSSVYQFGAKKGRWEPMPPLEDAVTDIMDRVHWLMDNI